MRLWLFASLAIICLFRTSVIRDQERRGIAIEARNHISCFVGTAGKLRDRLDDPCAEGTLDCGGLTPPWGLQTARNYPMRRIRPSSRADASQPRHRSSLCEGGVKPPHSKALRACSCGTAPRSRTRPSIARKTFWLFLFFRESKPALAFFSVKLHFPLDNIIMCHYT